MIETELSTIIGSLGDHVALDRDRLTPAMVEQPGLYAFYAIAHARAMREERTLKLQLENRRAVLRRGLSKSDKRVTESAIDEMCASDKVFTKASVDYVEAQYCADVLESVKRTFEHRRDMIVNLGASVREEMRSIEIRTPSKREPLFKRHDNGLQYAIGPREGEYTYGPMPYGKIIEVKGAPGDHIWELNDEEGPAKSVAEFKLGGWKHKTETLNKYFDECGVCFNEADIPF